MNRATEDLLDALHGTVAQELLNDIKAYKDGLYVDKDGNALPVPAALWGQAIKFLKDNGVDRAVKPGDPMDLLDEEVPEFDDEASLGATH